MRLKIPNIDRVGLVSDISQALAARGISIISMEVVLRTIYIEVEPLPQSKKQDIIAEFRNIHGVIDVLEIDLMPHQEKTEQLNAVLASASDGILAINDQAMITQCNPAAEKILGITASAAIGQYLAAVFPSFTILLNVLNDGSAFNNREIILENTHYLTSGRPIIDPNGRIIGAVAVLKDIGDVRDLINTVAGQQTLTFSDILYASKSMQRLVTLAISYARGDSTILIRGETGTGKELFARALHAASPRKDKPFITINCAAIPDTLLESELFGYEGGAFTGAIKGGKQGLFELANGGTVFLDEIGEISYHLQAKLLRALQDKSIRRIGGMREIPVNVRVFAATNRNLEEMIEKDRFRKDLYYRLNVIPLYIPPLRERREDIKVLAHSFLQRFSAKLQKKVTVISEAAQQKLENYFWPGNIRELENVIERSVNIVSGNVILSEHVILGTDSLSHSCKEISENRTLAEIINQTEREVIAAAFERCRSSRKLGAALGLSHTAVLKKLRKYGLAQNDMR